MKTQSNAITDLGWPVSFWFAVLSPALTGFLALFLFSRRKSHLDRCIPVVLKTTRRPRSARKVTNGNTPARNHRKRTGLSARKAPRNMPLQKTSATAESLPRI